MEQRLMNRPSIASPMTEYKKAPRIVIRGLRKHFTDIARQEEIVAIDGMDLDIGENEFLTILGPSGCGKTTLLNIVAGFDQATSGEITFDGDTIRIPGTARGVV